MTRLQISRQLFVWKYPKILYFTLVVSISVINSVSSASVSADYDPTIHSHSQQQQLTNFVPYSTNVQPRSVGGTTYYHHNNDPKNYYLTDSYGYGYAGHSNNGNFLSKQDSDDDGGDAAGLIGLIGLLGLAGLVPSLIPLLGPLLGLLLLLLLPVLAPILGPLLPIILLPLLLPLLLPILLLGLLFLPVPVVTVPAGRSSTTSLLPNIIDSDMARMLVNAISTDECIERITCEVTSTARNFGFNTDSLQGYFFGRKEPKSPKWMQSIARGAKSTESCKKYTCLGKLL